MKDLVTAGECAAWLRDFTWPLVTINIPKQSDRLYPSWDSIWQPYIQACTNEILPRIPKSVAPELNFKTYTTTVLNPEYNALQTELENLKITEEKIRAYQKETKPPRNFALLILGTGLGIAAGFYLTQKFIIKS